MKTCRPWHVASVNFQAWIEASGQGQDYEGNGGDIMSKVGIIGAFAEKTRRPGKSNLNNHVTFIKAPIFDVILKDQNVNP